MAVERVQVELRREARHGPEPLARRPGCRIAVLHGASNVPQAGASVERQQLESGPRHRAPAGGAHLRPRAGRGSASPPSRRWRRARRRPRRARARGPVAWRAAAPRRRRCRRGPPPPATGRAESSPPDRGDPRPMPRSGVDLELVHEPLRPAQAQPEPAAGRVAVPQRELHVRDPRALVHEDEAEAAAAAAARRRRARRALRGRTRACCGRARSRRSRSWSARRG